MPEPLSNKEMTILGLMSGTSLDGLDIAIVKFQLFDEFTFSYSILYTKYVAYNEQERDSLSNAANLSRSARNTLDIEYGTYLGQQARLAMEESKIEVDLIASHGHTIFHRPEEGVTLQIGDGQEIAHQTKKPALNDFRTQDVLLGGQGAPLVPIGDKLLFGEFDACINLGGFSNISYDEVGIRKAFDIGPLNIVLNELAQRLGKEYDHNGQDSRSGKLIPQLLEQLNSIRYFNDPPPKSLGREWVESNVLPLLSGYQTVDLMRTFTEHAAFQISKAINRTNGNSVLLSGGGTYNAFLIERLNHYSPAKVIVPNKELIEFKEALVFAFLAFLHQNSLPNVLSSVTGSSSDHIAGKMWKSNR